MDNNEWKKLLLSWANVLRICDQELNSLDDLVTSDFFPKLACKLLGQDSNRIRSIESAFLFLKEYYPSIDIDSRQLNENDLISAASLFLVHCSLNQVPKDPELQEKVCSLPHKQQCYLKSFLEKFMIIGKSSVTKERILSEITAIGQGNSSNLNSPAHSNTGIHSTPVGNITYLNLNNSSGNSSRKASRLKRLKNQIELLTSVQQELQEELDKSNQKNAKLSDSLISKDNEIARLKAEILNMQQSNEEGYSFGEPKADIKNYCNKCTDLTDKLQNMERDYSEIQEELSSVIAKGELKYASLSQDIVSYEIRLKQSLEKEDLLNNEINKLNSIIQELKATNQEQLEYLEELKRKPNDVSESSLPEFSLPEENLANQVVDLQLQELRQSVEDKDKEIVSLNENLTELKNVVKDLQIAIDKNLTTIKNIQNENENLMKENEKLNTNLLTNKETLSRFLDENYEQKNKIEEFKEVINQLTKENEKLNTNLLTNQETLSRTMDENYEQKNKIEEFKEVINQLTKENEKLNTNLNDKIKELEVITKEKANIIHDIKELEYNLKMADELRNGLVNDLASEKLFTEKLQSEKNILIENNESNQININCLQKKLTASETLAKQKENENKDLLEKLNFQQKNVACLEKQLTEESNFSLKIQNELLTIKSELEKVCNDNKHKDILIEEFQQFINQLYRRIDKMFEENEGKLCTEEKENVNSEESVAEENLKDLLEKKLVHFINEYMKNVESEKNALIENEKLLSELIAKNKEKHELLNNVQQKDRSLNAIYTETEKLKAILDDKGKLIYNLQKDNENLLAIISEKEKYIYEQQKDLSNKIDKIFVLDCENVQLKSKVYILEKQIDDKAKEIALLDEEKTNFKTKINALEIDNNDLLKVSSSKEQLINDLEIEKAGLLSKVKILDEETQKLKHLNNENELKIKEYINEHAKLLGEMVLLNVDLELSKKAMINAVKDIENLKEEILNKDNTNRIVLSKLEMLENSNKKYSETIVSLAEQKDTLEIVIENLKCDLMERLKDWEKVHKSDDEQFALKVKKNLDNLQAILTDEDMKLNDLINFIDEKNQMFIDVSDKLSQSAVEIKQLEMKINELEAQNLELNNDVTLLKDELTKMTEKEENMKTNIKTLNTDLFLKNRELKTKTVEIKSLKDARNKLEEQVQLLQKDAESLNKTRDIISATSNGLLEELDKAKIDLIALLNEQIYCLAEISGVKMEQLDNKDTLSFSGISEQLKIYFTKYKEEINAKKAKISGLEANIANIPIMKVQYENEVKSLLQSFHDYKTKTQEDMSRLIKEYDLVKEKYLNSKLRISEMELQMNDMEKNIRSEYEQKLNKLKLKMKQTYKEKLEDLTFSKPNESVQKLKEELRYERGKAMSLEKKLMEFSDKLLISQEENRRLLSENFAKPAPVMQYSSTRSLNHSPKSYKLLTSTPVMKAHSAEVLTGRNKGIDNLGHDLSPDDSLYADRRTSIRSLPRGIGNIFSLSSGRVFPSAEEAGEVFDDRCLSDLKAGIVNLPSAESGPERMSILQLRNSLCPPHLKSSYPVETQFLNPTDFKEDDIKSGTAVKLKAEPSGDKNSEDKKKFKIQISYKKPSPSSKTSGIKVGGVLKEQNRNPQKMTTPSRIRALFGRKPKDENSPISSIRSSKR